HQWLHKHAERYRAGTTEAAQIGRLPKAYVNSTNDPLAKAILDALSEDFTDRAPAVEIAAPSRIRGELAGVPVELTDRRPGAGVVPIDVNRRRSVFIDGVARGRRIPRVARCLGADLLPPPHAGAYTPRNLFS